MNRQITKNINKGAFSIALMLLAGAGCQNNAGNQTASNNAVGTSSPSQSSAISDKSKSATGKTKAPTTVVSKTSNAAPTAPKMTVSQKMGVDILKAFNATASMKGHTISVGTTADTVILNGKVLTAAQKGTAETIARQKAKGCKVINKIEVGAK